MSRGPLSRLSSFLLPCILVTSLAATADAQTSSTFEPTVGQAGKDVVWVPTPQELVERMLDMAMVTPTDFLMDLGSGDGRTVIAAAKRGVRAQGVEYNPDMVAFAQRKATEEGVTDLATFVEADLFETDFSDASVITMFLLPSINLRLRDKILAMEPGTRVVSNTFTMGDWEADEESEIGGDCTSWCSALLWIVPAKVEGIWDFPDGPLSLAQLYQFVSGSLDDTPISDGRLRGGELVFTVGDVTYTGQVDGNTMALTSSAGGRWTATRR